MTGPMLHFHEHGNTTLGLTSGRQFLVTINYSRETQSHKIIYYRPQPWQTAVSLLYGNYSLYQQCI
jgi:hypothetical protein